MASTFTVWSRRERRATTFVSAFESLASAYHFLAGQRRKSQFVGELLASARGRRLTQQQVAWMHKIATDDLEAARAYAQETGNCSFCHRELTDAPSVFAGYGPVCAAKRGLPWGEVAAPELEEVTS
ncbi:MAG: hypothetical protein KDE27_11365 [Planctomycetes bacterium]|nr:hypothetical protein [Planctomycetota bacterium]